MECVSYTNESSHGPRAIRAPYVVTVDGGYEDIRTYQRETPPAVPILELSIPPMSKWFSTNQS